MKYGIQTESDVLGPQKRVPAWLTTLVVLFSLLVICANWQDQRREPYQTLETSK